MIVSRTQFSLIRAGRLGTAYVPLRVAERWRPKRSYVALRVCEMVDGERQVRPTDFSVTIIGIGEPQPIASIVGRVEADPEHWKLLYPRHGLDCAWVAFALGDWRDHSRLLRPSGYRAGADARGYTATPELALDPDAECVSDEWLAKFAKDAEQFRQDRLHRREAARQQARRVRDKTRH